MSMRPYFLRGITAKGFVQFYDDLIEKMDAVLYIEGGATPICQHIFQHLINNYQDTEKIDYIYNHLQPDSLEGIVFPNQKIAIIDRAKMGEFRSVIYPKMKEHVVYLGEGYDENELIGQENVLKSFYEEKNEMYEETLKHFKVALSIHHDIEQLHLQHMNIDKANEETDQLIQSIFQQIHLNKPSHTVHRYLGAATSEGAIDFIPQLTEDVYRRIYIKGRSGTGKSTILKKMITEADKRGFDMEIYHCGFDPDSLDMVIFRELSLALFDATDPHSHDPEKSNDEIYDTFELFIGNDVISENELNQISELERQYKSEMKRAIEQLSQIKQRQEPIDSMYENAMNENELQEKIQAIDHWVAEKMTL